MKYFIGVILAVLFGAAIGSQYVNTSSSTDPELVEFYTLPQKDIDFLVSRSERNRGQPVWSLGDADLKLRYSIVDDTKTVITFADKKSDAQVALFCDASAHTVDVGYNLGHNNSGADPLFEDFGIMHIAKGATHVYEADNSVPLLYATDLGDTNLSEVLKDLNKLDQEDMVAFVFRDRDDDGIGFNQAWSYAFKVKDVVNALGQVNYSNCSNVELLVSPSKV